MSIHTIQQGQSLGIPTAKEQNSISTTVLVVKAVSNYIYMLTYSHFYVTNRHSSNNIQDSPQTSSKFNDPSVTGRPQQRPSNETHYNWIRIAEELHAGSWFVQAKERKELSISNASEKKRTNAHTQHSTTLT